MIVVRLLLTAILVVAAVIGLRYVWVTYFEAPWTRDAHVRANVIEVSSYVSGEIVSIDVIENQFVTAGDVLLRIDPQNYELSLAQAEANLDQATAQEELEAQQAARQTALNEEDPGIVANVNLRNQQLQAASATASRLAAEQARNEARLRLERTTIRARNDGWITNLVADVGDYVSAGQPITALIDASSFRVDAYFMETKLPAIEIGAPARIRLMSNGRVLDGRVQGISRGIYRPGTQPDRTLESPEPSFQWIRLAQRIPVRIDILEAAEDLPFPLVAGQTASVLVPRPGDDGVLKDMRLYLTSLWVRFQ